MEKYKFRTYRPADKDVVQLVLIRYTWTEDDMADAKGEVLTVDGWHQYEPYELLPTNLPEMDGIEYERNRQ